MGARLDPPYLGKERYGNSTCAPTTDERYGLYRGTLSSIHCRCYIQILSDTTNKSFDLGGRLLNRFWSWLSTPLRVPELSSLLRSPPQSKLHQDSRSELGSAPPWMDQPALGSYHGLLRHDDVDELAVDQKHDAHHKRRLCRTLIRRCWSEGIVRQRRRYHRAILEGWKV